MTPMGDVHARWAPHTDAPAYHHHPQTNAPVYRHHLQRTIRPWDQRLGGEVEVIIGWPQWMPEGATAVFVTVETEDGAHDSTERLHSRDGQRSWSEDEQAAVLVLPYRDAASITLHVMAEVHPYEPPRSIGGTTVMLPEAPAGARERRRLQLVAPLDVTVELVCTPAGFDWSPYYGDGRGSRLAHRGPEPWDRVQPLTQRVGSWRVLD